MIHGKAGAFSTYIHGKESTQCAACIPIDGCCCTQKVGTAGLCNKRLLDGHFCDGNHGVDILALVAAA